MADLKRNILDLSAKEAHAFFMRQDIYTNIPLPKYFVFSNLLNIVNTQLETNTLDLDYASKHEHVNYKIFANKDGQYSWRPLQLINPVLYVDLVNKITTPNNWNTIINRFNEFRKSQDIECCSIPIVTKENKTTKETIVSWWENVEQKSIELALFYDCCLQTDITDCYGSIYTHSISWAIHGKDKAKEQRTNDLLLGNIIDKYIRSMSYGQTNGIPQGSILMDFIAEIVLGHVDFELHKAIKKYNKENKSNPIGRYNILRYRDDYRIFTYGPNNATIIAKLLTEVLADFNLKLNTHKTRITTNIIAESIKADKLYWNEVKQESTSLQKTLLLIHGLASRYPNSGSIKKALDSFYDKVFPLTIFKEDSANTKVMASILLDIAYRNTNTYPITIAILGKILSLETDREIVNFIYKAILARFATIPNVGFLQVWLQRLTIKDRPELKFDEKLCQKVVNENIEIWDLSWLPEAQQQELQKISIIDKTKIKDMPFIPSPEEIKIFNQY